MKTKKNKGEIDIYFLIIAIYVIFIGACFIASVFGDKYQEKKDLKMWNNGYCTCGGQWVYEQAVEHRYGTSFMYHCDNCNNYIELKERY